MKVAQCPVFIIGGNHHNALGVIRSLGERDVIINVIIQSNDKNPYICRSKYISRYWIVSSEKEVIDILINESENFHGEKAVLIACADNLSSLVDMHCEELMQRYYLPCSSEQGRITHLMNKEVMSDLARKIGFLVPQSKAINISDNIEVDIPLPWIIKPLVSKNGKKADIRRIYTPEDWAIYCKGHDATVQVQQLIDKEFEYQLIGLSLNGGEDVLIPGYSYVIRPAATTNTGFLHYRALNESFAEVVVKGKKFLKSTGYSGLFSLEFLRGKDGNDYFMEINFRNDGNAICVTAAGINLPYIWYLYNTGGEFRQEIARSAVKPVYVMPEFADVSFVTHGQLNFYAWLKDIYKTDRFMEYDKHDKAPFFYYLSYRIAAFIKKRFDKFKL